MSNCDFIRECDAKHPLIKANKTKSAPGFHHLVVVFGSLRTFLSWSFVGVAKRKSAVPWTRLVVYGCLEFRNVHVWERKCKACWSFTAMPSKELGVLSRTRRSVMRKIRDAMTICIFMICVPSRIRGIKTSQSSGTGRRLKALMQSRSHDEGADHTLPRRTGPGLLELCGSYRM